MGYCLHQPGAGCRPECGTACAVLATEVDHQPELPRDLQFPGVEAGGGVDYLMQAVCVAVQGVLIQCVYVIYQAGEVQVQNGGGAIILVLGVGVTAGTQQVHGQCIDMLCQ